MSDRNNTIFGWVLGAGIAALGFTSLSGHYFGGGHGDEHEKWGMTVEGAEAGGGGAAAGPPMEMLMQTADVAKGEQVFKKCAACHTVNAGGANGIGPNLYGVVGKGIGSHAAGFGYSDALKTHGGSWDWTNLDAWLASPRKFANGTKMSFAGLSSAEDRANLMAYLNAQGSNMALPAAPAAAPAADAAAAPAAEGAEAATAAEGAAPAAK